MSKDPESGEMKIARVKESQTVIGGVTHPVLPRRVESVSELLSAQNEEISSMLEKKRKKHELTRKQVRVGAAM